MFERSMMRLIPGIFRYERMGGEMGKIYREWRCLLATTLCLGILGFGPVSADNHEFSIAILPDIQTYTVKRPQILEAQVDWIATNQVTENIIYVGQLGDLKNGVCNNGTIAWPSLGSPSTEWDIVRDAFDVLDLAVIPYGVTPGNHDFDQANGVFPADSGGCPNFDSERPLLGYNGEFPPSSFPVTNYGSRLPGNNEDNFTIVSSNGVNFLFINVGYQQETPAVGSTTVIDWAETLMTTYPNHITIVTSHFLIDCNASTTGGGSGPNGSCAGTPDYLVSTYGTNIFDRLRAYPNLFMMIGGHRFGESYFEFDRSAEGFKPVHVVLANYQHLQYSGTNFDTVPILGGANGESGYFKLMRFDMDSMIVDLVSLSPALAAQSSIAGSPPILPVLSNVARPTTVFSTRDIDPTNPANLVDGGGNPTLHTQSVSNLVNISFAGYVPTLFVAHGFAQGISRVEADGTGLVELVSGRSILDVVVDSGAGKMYWAELFAGGPPDDELRRSNIDGTGIESLNVGETINGVDLDVGAGKVYYAQATASIGDTAGVHQANLDGTAKTLVAAGVPTFVAVDPTGQQVYWTNRTQGFIRRANIDGTGLQTLLSGEMEPQDIELDVASGHMYWTDTTTREVLRANLDGTGRTVIIPASQFAGNSRPFGVALDLVGQKLYWTVHDAGPNRIERSNLDGTGIEVVSNGFAKDVIGLDLVRLP